MKHLYIIGNGFDIHHGINSSYNNFREWLENEDDHELLLDMDEVYGYCDDEWWSNFEENLASLDVIDYADQIASENVPDLTSDHCDSMWTDAQVYVEQGLESLFSKLYVCFRRWILQLNRPDESRMLKIELSDSVFLNFNYTRTLEELYTIDSNKVVHIHGCAGCDGKLIVGHGKTYKELEKMNQTDEPKVSDDINDEEIQEYNDYIYEDEELHEILAKDAALKGVASQRKPVEKIISENNSFFDSLHDVRFVHVYGFSFSDVDMPYIEKINSVIDRDVIWEISDYNGDNKNRINWFVDKYKIRKFSIIELTDLTDRNQLKIDFGI